MSLVERIRSLFGRTSVDESTNSDRLREAAAVLAEKRGDNASAQPAERGGYSTDNVKNAARDLGPNVFTGPDAIGEVGKGYRSSK